MRTAGQSSRAGARARVRRHPRPRHGRSERGENLRRSEADVVERLGPLLDVRGGVALRRNGTFGCGLGCQGQGEHVTVFDCVKFRAKIFVPNQSDISRPGTVIDALPGEPCYIIDTILRYRVINTLPGT